MAWTVHVLVFARSQTEFVKLQNWNFVPRYCVKSQENSVACLICVYHTKILFIVSYRTSLNVFSLALVKAQ